MSIFETVCSSCHARGMCDEVCDLHMNEINSDYEDFMDEVFNLDI